MDRVTPHRSAEALVHAPRLRSADGEELGVVCREDRAKLGEGAEDGLRPCCLTFLVKCPSAPLGGGSSQPLSLLISSSASSFPGFLVET